MVLWASLHGVEFVRCSAVSFHRLHQLLGKGGCLGGCYLHFAQLFATNPVAWRPQVPPAVCSDVPSLKQVLIFTPPFLCGVTAGLNCSANLAIWVSNVKAIGIFSVWLNMSLTSLGKLMMFVQKGGITEPCSPPIRRAPGVFLWTKCYVSG